MKYRKALTFTVLLFLCTLFSQENNKVPFSLFFKEINKLKLKEVNFTKTSHFFLKKEWDSVLVFSSKALLFNKQQNINNYIHYMRGYSFMKKKLYTESLKEYEKVNTNFPFYHKIIRNLGGISLEQRNYKKAILYFEQLNNITDAVSAYEKSSVIHDTGIAYFHLEDYKKATTNLLKAIQLQENNQDTLRLIGSYMDIANVYYEQYKDDIAIPYFEKAYILSSKVSDFEIRRKTALNMSVVEENRKNFAKSLVYRKEFEKWKDSLNNQQKIWSVAQFEKKLAITQKQKEIDLLASQNKLKDSQRNSLLVSSFLLLFLLIISIYFYIQKNKNHQIITRQKEELNLSNKTKDKLFSIVSHDLRSSVNLMKRTNNNLLKKITPLNDSLLSNIVLSNISVANSTYNILENLLNWATLQTKQLYFRIESVDLYSIMKQVEYNFIPIFESKNITFQNQINQASFILADIDSLKIIIRNLLDNAVKFSGNNGMISVHSKEVDDFIQLTIEDNGIGMSEETIIELLKETPQLAKKKNQQEIGTGLGIQLCKTLAQKNNATFTIKSTEGKGTQILLSFKKP
ncbi:tetratricopeptide repeat-containing sensor histidine kinase [Tenacibaculum ascidiaceicola]|uniref:tetratricopeptide repeat-containing sensor histidine kinase n=1 Tax=Tenacibaculum ascidiaceicola TaxID=1699411 RepID=UPI0039E97D50